MIEDGEQFLKTLISDQDIDDILTSAFEGGINYWCREANGRADAIFLKANGTISLKTHDPADPKPAPLTAAAMRRAIVKEAVRRFLLEQDASTADCIVQQAVFNEIVFG